MESPCSSGSGGRSRRVGSSCRPVPASRGRCRRDPFERCVEANFLPDGKRIVFGAAEPGRTPTHLRAEPHRRGASCDLTRGCRDGRTGDAGWPIRAWLVGGPAHALPGGRGHAAALPVLASGDRPLQWSPDGRLLFVRRRNSWPPAIDRVDMVTNQRQPWRVVSPADPVGVDNMSRGPYYAGREILLSRLPALAVQLFIVEGLR